jgi:DNA polymerase alpha subunit A
MPQVQVALRALGEGRTVRVNDVISYITTAPTEGSSSSAAKRAYSPMDVTKSQGALKPDIDWYLAKQLFPPIERLCAPIAGTDAGQLAESLGLDPKRYALGAATARGETGLEISPLESQLPDSVRYQDCPRLTLQCLKCNHTFVFEGLDSAATLSALAPTGVRCPQPDCHAPFRPLTVVAQVEHAVRMLTAKYYDGWLACDDPACGVRGRSLSVYGHRCLGPQGHARGCAGRARYEVSGRLVGCTLGYWKGLWDVDRLPKGEVPNAEEKERLQALRNQNRLRFDAVRGVLEGYEKRCGWVWVQMDGLFAFAMR